MKQFYTVEQPAVTEAIAEAFMLFPRIDDLYNALTWRLERDPYPSEARLIAPDTFLIKSESWEYPGFCIITMIYTVTESSICVEDIRFDAIPET